MERYTNTELIQRYRFSRTTIQTILLPLVFPDWDAINRGLPVPPIIKLCIALRFFASGSYQRVCGDLRQVSQSSVSRIIKEVSEVLCLNIGKFIKFPTPEEINRNRLKFFISSGFPGVVGSVDGTHIEIKSPGGQFAENFRNRKSWFSLNVQVVSGPANEIFDIVVRWPGSTHDSRIFRSCSAKTRFENGEFDGLLLGDSAYRQTNYLFTPVDDPTTNGERQYNLAHARARNVVERTFGIWKQRFRCIHHCLNYGLLMNMRIIAATAVLHNIANNSEHFVDDVLFNERIVPMTPVVQQQRGVMIRAAFIERHFGNRAE